MSLQAVAAMAAVVVVVVVERTITKKFQVATTTPTPSEAGLARN
jgi:hypothetical protein